MSLELEGTAMANPQLVELDTLISLFCPFPNLLQWLSTG